mmetsp:Transcript_35911/g.84974  ORF Transcript_35911/g.84974 Transcript_35911/m.84974 type:complete len:196 (+) Transcript_35911:119-706(+)
MLFESRLGAGMHPLLFRQQVLQRQRFVARCVEVLLDVEVLVSVLLGLSLQLEDPRGYRLHVSLGRLLMQGAFQLADLVPEHVRRVVGRALSMVHVSVRAIRGKVRDVIPPVPVVMMVVMMVATMVVTAVASSNSTLMPVMMPVTTVVSTRLIMRVRALGRVLMVRRVEVRDRRLGDLTHGGGGHRGCSPEPRFDA